MIIYDKNRTIKTITEQTVFSNSLIIFYIMIFLNTEFTKCKYIFLHCDNTHIK